MLFTKKISLYTVQESVTNLDSNRRFLKCCCSIFKPKIIFRTMKTVRRDTKFFVTKYFFKFTKSLLVLLIIFRILLGFLLLIVADADKISDRCRQSFTLWQKDFAYRTHSIVKATVDEALREIKKKIYAGEILNALHIWVDTLGRLERYKEYFWKLKPFTEKDHKFKMELQLNLMLNLMSREYTLKVTKYFFKYLPWISESLPIIQDASKILNYLIIFVGIILIIYAILTEKPNEKYQKK
jgi:hypothetical protein